MQVLKMIQAITFDTLAFAKKIEASGVEPKHAEAIAEALSSVFENSRETLATKQEISLLRKEMEKLSFEFDSKLSKVRMDIIMWVVGLLFAQTAILISIIKFIH